ncbi:hypothetical protein ACROYT_G008095 [Oculina patagonica]
MAYVLTQIPVHCGAVQLLKEPDVLPKFKYLFEKELGSVTLEESERGSDVELQVHNEVGKQFDMVSCKDSETNSDIEPEQNSEEKDVIIVDIIPCEPQMVEDQSWEWHVEKLTLEITTSPSVASIGGEMPRIGKPWRSLDDGNTVKEGNDATITSPTWTEGSRVSSNEHGKCGGELT